MVGVHDLELSTVQLLANAQQAVMARAYVRLMTTRQRLFVARCSDLVEDICNQARSGADMDSRLSLMDVAAHVVLDAAISLVRPRARWAQPFPEVGRIVSLVQQIQVARALRRRREPLQGVA